MPYYKKINTLFIHIPKTGGNSVEEYLAKRYKETLKRGTGKFIFDDIKFNKFSLQHQYYSTIKKYAVQFDVDFKNNLKVFTIVRNPYDRLISDMIFQNFINIDSTPEQVFLQTPTYFSKSKDNHHIEQFKFLVNEHDIIDKDITIMKTENLKNDMYDYGFSDFNLNINRNKYNLSTYDKFFNDDIIDLVNFKYHKDFEYFNYEKK